MLHVVILCIISLIIFCFINVQISIAFESEEIVEKNLDEVLKRKESSKEISQFIVETETNSSKMNRRMIELEIFKLKYPNKAKEMNEQNTYNIINIEKYEQKHLKPLNKKQISDLKESLKKYKKFTSLKENAKNSIPILLSISSLLVTEIMNLIYKGVKKKNKILKHSYTIFTRVSALFIIMGYYVSMFYISKYTDVNYFTFLQYILYLLYTTIHTIITYILYKVYDLEEE